MHALRLSIFKVPAQALPWLHLRPPFPFSHFLELNRALLQLHTKLRAFRTSLASVALLLKHVHHRRDHVTAFSLGLAVETSFHRDEVEASASSSRMENAKARREWTRRLIATSACVAWFGVRLTRGSDPSSRGVCSALGERVGTLGPV